MIDWKKVAATDCAVPADAPMDDLVRELSRALADPDPLVRDGEPYGVLATWIERGTIPAPRRLELGHEMAARFTDPRVEARTFAPLVLDMLVSAGDFETGWVDAFEQWYPAERDLRGHDGTLGWLHAVAHGADLLGTFGRHPEVAPTRMLDLAAARLTAPTDHVYDQLEDDRLARAVALVLTRTDLSESDSVDWLEPIADRFGADRVSTPVPAHLSNCLRTLRLLYLLADRGVRPTSELPQEPLHHREAVKSGVAAVLDRIVRR
ncbi:MULTISPECIES: DUF2785 domain-containing protein [unclassified Streptomyces]|uniref:DUF2785 domain-containing protein n=1 Tax=unclassified Streptomyces TaxID=2593676 RepID=UPI0006F5FAC7|nr:MULTISPECIES: DUF2785 domain-containing protein [unclassified Streptomyces]KQX57347.1 hypothetical protein ASD33_26990 [Streptomyces sp. Root1304]KRA98719.1 hypothetical protein ASE09_23800 [Streptomyces sp. Root66D1]